MDNNKFIWVDIDNSPHVMFFEPIIDMLRQKVIKFVTTARDKSETLGLMNLKKIKYFEISESFKYNGKNCFFKILITLVRALKLVFFMRKKRKYISFAVNHGSRSHILAAYFLRIPIVVFDDYEHSNITLYKRFVYKLFVPQYIPKQVLIKKGIPAEKIVRYPGFKEEVYLHHQLPDKQLLKRLGINKDQIVVTLRPPANNAHYYNDQENVLFEKLIDLLSQRKDATVVVLPRGKVQYMNLREKVAKLKNFIILSKPVDSFSLIYYSDIVIGGGGTMNREAAIIGTPVYSIFLGNKPSVDKALSDQGRLEFISNISELSKIKFEKKHKNTKESNSSENNLVDFISMKLEKIYKEKR